MLAGVEAAEDGGAGAGEAGALEKKLEKKEETDDAGAGADADSKWPSTLVPVAAAVNSAPMAASRDPGGS
jgi:hypothetical protein